MVRGAIVWVALDPTRGARRILRDATAVTLPPDLEASLLGFLRSRRG